MISLEIWGGYSGFYEKYKPQRNFNLCWLSAFSSIWLELGNTTGLANHLEDGCEESKLLEKVWIQTKCASEALKPAWKLIVSNLAPILRVMKFDLTKALVGTNPKNIVFFRGDAGTMQDDRFIDVWRTPLRIKCDKQIGVLIQSAGEDKTFDTDDDYFAQHPYQDLPGKGKAESSNGTF